MACQPVSYCLSTQYRQVRSSVSAACSRGRCVSLLLLSGEALLLVGGGSGATVQGLRRVTPGVNPRARRPELCARVLLCLRVLKSTFFFYGCKKAIQNLENSRAPIQLSPNTYLRTKVRTLSFLEKCRQNLSVLRTVPNSVRSFGTESTVSNVRTDSVPKVVRSNVTFRYVLRTQVRSE